MQRPNNLIKEKSPYLLQHAYNPVNWYAWNEDTLALAKEKQLPIFLSVGYSTCYWCHVMERESFENSDIAELMNKHFVNIKVDREERPDIDRVYMSALQSISGSGGWPMNIFLTPDLKPFYAATYIPPREKYGRAGFEDILIQIGELWESRRDEVFKSSDKIFSILSKNLTPKIKEDNQLNTLVYEKFFDTVKNIYDYENGGFGNGNKFPRPAVFDFLLKYYYGTKDIEALDIVTFSLKQMYKGGIYDQLGQGFHRYSVDKFWRVPHFEKMLYDQAQIVINYLEVYQLTNDDFFLNVAKEVLNYVSNILKSEEGGFYSAEDAESSLDAVNTELKEEGFFYLWEKREIDRILGKSDSDVFCYAYGIMFEGNTINDPHDVFGKKNVLYKAFDEYEIANRFNKSPEEVVDILNKAKEKLISERNKRVRPGLDKKILTSWNGLMISAFSKAFEITKEKKYYDNAQIAADFILNNIYKDNILFHRYVDGDIKFPGMLEDYAFLIRGLISLYECGFNLIYFEKAIELTDLAVEYFYDDEFGGFFDSMKSNEDVILRTKDIYDGAEPSANSIMLENLLKLNIFTEGKFYEELSMKSLENFWEDVEKYPFSHPRMLCSLDLYLNSLNEILITKGINEDLFLSMLNKIHKAYIPNRILVYANDEFKNKFPITNKLVTDNKDSKVYICRNFVCETPITDMDFLQKTLK